MDTIRQVACVALTRSFSTSWAFVCVFVFFFVFLLAFVFVLVFVFFFVFLGANNTNDWLEKKVSATHKTRTIIIYIIRQLDNNGKDMNNGNMIAIVVALTLATAT